MAMKKREKKTTTIFRRFFSSFLLPAFFSLSRNWKGKRTSFSGSAPRHASVALSWCIDRAEIRSGAIGAKQTRKWGDRKTRKRSSGRKRVAEEQKGRRFFNLFFFCSFCCFRSLPLIPSWLRRWLSHSRCSDPAAASLPPALSIFAVLGTRKEKTKSQRQEKLAHQTKKKQNKNEKTTQRRRPPRRPRRPGCPFLLLLLERRRQVRLRPRHHWLRRRRARSRPPRGGVCVFLGFEF